MGRAFKRQIYLKASTEEHRWEATIPHPSDDTVAAFIWLSRGKDGVPAEIRTALAAYLDAVTQFHAERKEGKA